MVKGRTRTKAKTTSKEANTGDDLDAILNDSIWDLDKAYQKQLARQTTRPKNPLTYSKKDKNISSPILPKQFTHIEEQQPSAKSTKSKNILPKDITKPTRDPPKVIPNTPSTPAQIKQKTTASSSKAKDKSTKATRKSTETIQENVTNNAKQPDTAAAMDIDPVQNDTQKVKKPKRDKGKGKAVPVPSTSTTKKKTLSLSKNKTSSTSTAADSESNSNDSSNTNSSVLPLAGPSTKETMQRTTSSTASTAAGSALPDREPFASLDDFIQDDKDLTELTLSPIKPSGDAIVRNPKFMHIEILGSTPSVSSTRPKRSLFETDESGVPKKLQRRLSLPRSPTRNNNNDNNNNNETLTTLPADLPNLSLETESNNIELTQAELDMSVEEYLKHLVEEQITRIRNEGEARIKQVQHTVQRIKESILADASAQATSQ